MPSTINVVALVSGGKDSLFSILHCIRNGHRVVALANLHPLARAVNQNGSSTQEMPEDDLNSFMYQTVGHTLIPLYAKALGLPLYRQEITGSAVQTARDYDTSTQQAKFDETEHLITLLEEVKRQHPEVNAVCTGAILSTYQRTRIESVAIRLNLIPLTYLWQYPALPPPPDRQDSLTGLLDDMEAAGCDARIIKIASGGIKDSMLWTNVADSRTRSRLVSGMAPFFSDHEFWLRGAVLGEGGEYETLAINGPPSVWKKRIQVEEIQNTVFSGDGGTSYMYLGAATLADNDSNPSDDRANIVRQPVLLDPQFSTVRDALLRRNLPPDPGRNGIAPEPPTDPEMVMAEISTMQSATHVVLANVTASGVADAGVQMHQIIQIVKERLGLIPGPTSSPSNIVFSMLLLSDMYDFALVNPIYASMFPVGEPNPPARVTIAANLPAHVKVSLTVLLDGRNREIRRGLHVQSRSYWAPANIGPYSQAICEPFTTDQAVNIHDPGLAEVVHMAGQIPLVPHTMELLDESFPAQAILSLQHLWRVGQERDIDFWPWGVAFLAATDDIASRVDTADFIWRQAHTTPTHKADAEAEADADENEETDVWHQQYNRYAATSRPTLGHHLYPLPNTTRLPTPTPTPTPPAIIAEVVALPRNAPIEWWSTGLSHLSNHTTVRHARIWGWTSSSVVSLPPAGETEVFTSILVRTDSTLDINDIMNDALALAAAGISTQPSATITGTALSAGGAARLSLPNLQSRYPAGLAPALAHIPCTSLWGANVTLSGADARSERVARLQLALLLRVRIASSPKGGE